MQKLFDVIANEDESYGTVGTEITIGDTVALEEAGQAIAEADAVITLVDDSEAFGIKLDKQIAVESAMLDTPEQITAATASLALGTASLMASKVTGTTSAVGIEDEIVDPVRSFTVGLEEKRGIAKKLYDSSVIIMKKLVNMIKKAFAKVVMTLNGNEGSLKKLKALVVKVKTGTTIKGDDIESIIGKSPVLTFAGFKLSSSIDLLEGSLDNEAKQTAYFSSVVDTAQKISDMFAISDIKPGLSAGLTTEIFKEVHAYVAGKKEKLFGDSVTGSFDFTVYSYTSGYVRVIISSAKGNDTSFVYDKKIKLEDNITAKFTDEVFDSVGYAKLIDVATSANKGIKKFLDSSMKEANKMLDLSSRTAKKADSNDNADSEAIKLQIKMFKASGTTGYGIAMDRFKNIRSVISIGNKLVDAVNASKK